MTTSPDAVRAHLVRLLEWEDAHVSLEQAVAGLPADRRGARVAGFPHSPWELLEHIRIAQADILEYCTSPTYVHTRRWPEDYWPAAAAPPSDAAWADTLERCRADRRALQALATTVEDLGRPVPTGAPDHTYLRAFLLAADHAAYHVGQLVAVRRALGAWPT
ncbi:hypothetical protein TBR22_A18280 [Luteitalea sp. TBR-22]|uniref:DinB family protein n=1 Tax=Luteitalea sp. TBR-22 TaxID=2802971 RepID=UPI001AFAC7B9|nr:DinB family protein [Luteitalea sp. TBR-22]BCS32614.1 hypothetical protein TBR22_A18280 [Luteitalea sp. TBR-22]